MTPEQISKIAFLRGQATKDVLFSTLDTNRGEMHHFFRASSQVLWNGTPVTGAAAVTQFFATVPPTTHHVTAVDAQPVMNTWVGAAAGACCILITARGTVTFGLKGKRQECTFRRQAGDVFSASARSIALRRRWRARSRAYNALHLICKACLSMLVSATLAHNSPDRLCLVGAAPQSTFASSCFCCSLFPARNA
jgi:hypothetical protein